MLVTPFAEIIQRDVEKFREEIRLFPDERLWSVQGDIKNSAGNLALHLAGNLKHFIGATLGNTGYVRERDKEFSERNVPKEQLLKGLEEAAAVAKHVLTHFPDEKVMQPYPLETFGKNISTLQALAQIIVHLNYHLGQVNYLRRMS